MTPAAPALARSLADALEGARIPYAVGGALALAVWGFPRATSDVDLDVSFRRRSWIRSSTCSAGRVVKWTASPRAGARPSEVTSRCACTGCASTSSCRKFLFFRTKDILDVERLVAFGGESFDRDYVRQRLVDLVGDSDERVTRWDRLIADVSASLA